MPAVMRPSVDFPQPDSPTRPSDSPLAIERLTSHRRTSRVFGRPRAGPRSGRRGQAAFEALRDMVDVQERRRHGARSLADGRGRCAGSRTAGRAVVVQAGEALKQRGANGQPCGRSSEASACDPGSCGASRPGRARPARCRAGRACRDGAATRSPRSPAPPRRPGPRTSRRCRPRGSRPRARSCVIQINAVPVSSRTSRASRQNDLRLDRDVERGRRLVGDDEAGLCRSAMAIATRWRMPPESWCG